MYFYRIGGLFRKFRVYLPKRRIHTALFVASGITFEIGDLLVIAHSGDDIAFSHSGDDLIIHR